jgi:hypothetical protein
VHAMSWTNDAMPDGFLAYLAGSNVKSEVTLAGQGRGGTPTDAAAPATSQHADASSSYGGHGGGAHAPHARAAARGSFVGASTTLLGSEGPQCLPTPVSMSITTPFRSTYVRNNKGAVQKNIRCFPQCHFSGHRTNSFCGSPVQVRTTGITVCGCAGVYWILWGTRGDGRGDLGSVQSVRHSRVGPILV